MLSPRRARLRVSALLLTVLTAGGVAVTATPAEAGTYQTRLVAEASRHRGAPYQWGAAGPSRFDCSGFTMYVFSKFGRKLPHNSAQQYASVHHVANSRLAPGDLMFFRNSSGRISHVALYAGNGKMWHAPKSGDVVRLAPVYSRNYVLGRI